MTQNAADRLTAWTEHAATLKPGDPVIVALGSEQFIDDVRELLAEHKQQGDDLKTLRAALEAVKPDRGRVPDPRHERRRAQRRVP